MAAITWRSLNAAVPDVGRNLSYAQEAFDRSFGRLDKMVTDQQAVNQGAIDREDEALFQSAMNRLADVRDPGQLTQMQESGEIAALRDALKPKFQGQFRGADDARLQGIQQQTQQGWQFADQNALREHAPIIDQYNGMVASGKVNEAEAFIKPYIGKIPGLGKMLQAGAETGRAIEAHQSTTTLQGQQGAAVASNAETNSGRLTLEQQNQRFNTFSILRTGTADLAARIVAQEKNVAGSAAGVDSLIKNITQTAPSKNIASNLVGLANTALSADPRYRRLPTDVVQSIVLKQTNNVGEGLISWLWDPSKNSVVAAMKGDLDKALEDNKDRMVADESGINNLRVELQRNQLLLDDAQAVAFPQLQQRMSERLAALSANPGASQPAQPGQPGQPAAAGPRGDFAPAVQGGDPDTIPPDLREELARQRREINEGVRPREGYTDPVRKALEQDRVVGQRAAEQLEQRRVAASQAAGIPVPEKPSGISVKDILLGSRSVGRDRVEAQRRYETWQRAMDRRIKEDEEKRSGNSR
jgi:hypothetical protein